MIDKRTVHQMYLISHFVSESMHVLLPPFPGWNPGLTEINGKTSINSTGARISSCASLRAAQWWRPCQGFISSRQISQVLENLHSFMQEPVKFFPPLAGAPIKYISIWAKMTNKLDQRGISLGRISRTIVWSFPMQAAVSVISLLDLTSSISKNQVFYSSCWRLQAFFCWYLGTLLLAAWIHNNYTWTSKCLAEAAILSFGN